MGNLLLGSRSRSHKSQGHGRVFTVVPKYKGLFVQNLEYSESGVVGNILMGSQSRSNKGQGHIRL